jgi:hypothetical protein
VPNGIRVAWDAAITQSILPSTATGGSNQINQFGGH